MQSSKLLNLKELKEVVMTKRRSKRTRPIDPMKSISVIYPGYDLKRIFGELQDVEKADLYYVLGENEVSTDDEPSVAVQSSDYNSSDGEVLVPKVCCKIIVNETKPRISRRKRHFSVIDSPATQQLMHAYELPVFGDVVISSTYFDYALDTDDENFLNELNSNNRETVQRKGHVKSDSDFHALTESQFENMIAVMEGEFDIRSRLMAAANDTMSEYGATFVFKSFSSRHAQWTKLVENLSLLESGANYRPSPTIWTNEELLAILPLEDAVAALKKSSNIAASVVEQYACYVHRHWVLRRVDSKSSLLRGLHRFAWSKNSHLDTAFPRPPLLPLSAGKLHDIIDKVQRARSGEEKGEAVHSGRLSRPRARCKVARVQEAKRSLSNR